MFSVLISSAVFPRIMRSNAAFSVTRTIKNTAAAAHAASIHGITTVVSGKKYPNTASTPNDSATAGSTAFDE